MRAISTGEVTLGSACTNYSHIVSIFLEYYRLPQGLKKKQLWCLQCMNSEITKVLRIIGRSISLFSTFLKAFLVTCCARATAFFVKQNLLSPNQHAYIQGRPTTSTLVPFTWNAARAVCHRYRLDVSYFDLQKAFAVVDHELLLPKLFD